MIAASKQLDTDCNNVNALGRKKQELECSHQMSISLLELTTVFELLRSDPCAVNSNR